MTARVTTRRTIRMTAVMTAPATAVRAAGTIIMTTPVTCNSEDQEILRNQS
ncbi:hypothetical protein SAMN05443665_101464 [Actinomadura meyerae]|uniref:Uncharacterized protein n=1 Tax=Actinomadura meyerae TaxID=240840 RepID=A0A239J7M2_9ACTN|nr:hypothetical protein [Actinomadura meyerae]SNT02006.1 hypothetical protein SAMN05443665_101464 [Actinomadura meyerae]